MVARWCEAFIARWLDLKRQRRVEIGAVLDWLDAAAMFDGDKAAILAASFGATFVSSHILASEPRIRTAVLMSGYVANIDADRFPDVVNPNTYWPVVELPILVLNGRYDIATHQNESRDMLIRTIGTSVESKRSVLYDSSHWPLPPHRVERDVIEWLDRHLGPAR